MILTALISAMAFTSPIEDYFPLVPGTKWTYEDGNGLQMEDEIGRPVDLPKNGSAFPKTSSVGGRSSGAELYTFQGDTAFLVGTLDSNPRPPMPALTMLKEPQPILRVGTGKSEWNYVTDVPTGLGPVLCKVHGESSRGSKRKILDREVETLNVHVVSRLGNDNQTVEVQDDAVYGKGIGLIEMREATKSQGQTVKKVLKLVKFEPPQG